MWFSNTLWLWDCNLDFVAIYIMREMVTITIIVSDFYGHSQSYWFLQLLWFRYLWFIVHVMAICWNCKSAGATNDVTFARNQSVLVQVQQVQIQHAFCVRMMVKMNIMKSWKGKNFGLGNHNLDPIQDMSFAKICCLGQREKWELNFQFILQWYASQKRH